MNHAITIGGLLSVSMVLGGLLVFGFGALMTFAGGMSDAPAEGASTSRTGCFVAIIGGGLLFGGVWGLFV